MVNIGRYPGQVCYTYYDWETGEPSEVCEDRETIADLDVSTTARSSPAHRACSCRASTMRLIYTRGLGWMLMNEFLESQGVLEMSQLAGARREGIGQRQGTDRHGVPDRGRLLPGLSGWSSTSVFVCHGKGGGAHTLSVAFPETMDTHLKHGDQVGLCKADAPL